MVTVQAEGTFHGLFPGLPRGGVLITHKRKIKRMGQKKAPFYRIVVADARSPRDGRFIEEIGTYDPTKNPSEFHVNEEAAKKWLANGAQPTEVVGKIFKLAGIEK